MSQRLHVGKTDSDFYDCVISSPLLAGEKLKNEWFRMNTRIGVYYGPWKIIIGDMELFHKIEADIALLFQKLGMEYPDAVWMFFQDNKPPIEHPTREELDVWLQSNQKNP